MFAVFATPRGIVGPFALFASWAAFALVLVGVLSRAHYAPLAEAPPAVASRESGSWRVVHVLVAGCPCSAIVAAHLMRRGTAADLDETVVVQGEEGSLAAELSARGWSVVRSEADSLFAAYKLAGGPWLVVHEPGGRAVYVGGYRGGAVQAGGALLDREIVAALRRGEAVPPFVPFGCTLDPVRQRAVDPFALKYRS